MAAYSTSDVLVLSVGIILAAVYLFRDSLFAASKPKAAPVTASKGASGGGNPRDFIAKMKEGVRCALSVQALEKSANTAASNSTEEAHRHLLRVSNRYC